MPKRENEYDQLGFPVRSQEQELRSEFGHLAPSKSARFIRWVLFVGVLLTTLVVVARKPALKWLGEFVSNIYFKTALQERLKFQLQSAKEHLDSSLEWQDSNAKSLKLRAEVCALLNDHEQSERDARRLIELNPVDAEAHLQLGNSLISSRRPKEAIAAYEDAAKFGVMEQDTLLNNLSYARALARIDLDKALKDIDRALAIIAPDRNPSYLDTRGFILHLQGNHAEALPVLDEAVKLQEAGYRESSFKNFPRGFPGEAQRNLLNEHMEESLGVIIYHRSLVHKALGNAQLAADDLSKAKSYGYSPEIMGQE